MSDPTPVRVGEDAGREAIIEQIACCLAKQDGWTNPYAPWTDNVGSIARGQLGDPVWREYREDAEAVADGQLADFFARASAAEAEVARLKGELQEARDGWERWKGLYAGANTVIRQLEKERDEARDKVRTLEGAARDAEYFAECAEAYKATASALRERVARLEEAIRPFATYAENIPGADFGEGEIGEYIHGGLRVSIRTQDLKAARAALPIQPAAEGGAE